MLTFASPQFAWAFALPAAVLILYLLRRRFVPRPVPSTFLWQKSMRDHAANRPLRRLRKTLLLPVQLAAMLALVLGLMQPCITGDEVGRTILIFDISGSMQAVSNGTSRLDEARERAEDIMETLPAGEEFTVLACGAETRQLVSATRDREEVHRAIGMLQCEKGTADLSRALSLAEAIRREKGEARVIVFTDSDLPDVSVAAVGQPAENRAVYAIAAEEGTVYARVANYGADCTITLTCSADGQLTEAKELRLPEGETAGIRFVIPQGAVKAEVAIREPDAIAADNRVETAVMRNTEYTVALTADSLFLESALRVRNDLTIVRASVEKPEDIPADLYIVGDNPVIFTLHPETTAFSWGDEKTAEAMITVSPEAEPADGLTMRDVTLRAFRPVSGGKPVLFSGEDAIAAYTDSEVILAFDLHDSNLPLKYDFPVLVQNILEILIPRQVSAVTETEPMMPPEESDVREAVPEARMLSSAEISGSSRDLTQWFFGAFLLLLLLEFILSRMPFRRCRK